MNFYTEPLGDLLKHFDADPQRASTRRNWNRRAKSTAKTYCASRKSPPF